MLCRLVAEYEQFWRNMQCLCSGPKFLAATWLHSDTTLKTTIWSHMHTNLKICIIFADFQQFFLPLRPYASMDGQQMNSQSVSSDTTISTPDVPSFFHPDVQNHLMTTCFTCVVGHCCTLQNSPLLGLCNGSCVSATAGTGFLGSHVEWSVIVPNFNDTLEMVPS